MLLLSMIVIGLCADTAFRRYLEKKDFRQHMAKIEQEDLAELIASWAEEGELKGMSGAQILTALHSKLAARSQRPPAARSSE
jgi:hypothetical protein